MSSITRENHNVNEINLSEVDVDKAVDSANSSRLGLWDAYEYGVSREDVQAQLAAARTPEQRQAVIDDLRTRSIKRADLAEIDGRIACAVAGDAPWHELGTMVDGAMTSEEAIKYANLDHQHLKFPLGYPVNGQIHLVDGVYGVGRFNDAGEVEIYDGVSVGSGYNLYQNREAFSFLDRIMDGCAMFDSCGATDNGKKVFMSVKFEDFFEAVPGDEVHHYGLFTNAHDGTEAVRFFGTDTRTVCANTRRQALTANGGIAISHTRNMRAAIKVAERAIHASHKEFKTFGEMAEVMVRSQVDPRTFAEKVADGWAASSDSNSVMLTSEQIDAGFNTFAGDADPEDFERLEKVFNRRSSKRLVFITDLLKLDGSATNTAEGSIWGSFNATTEYANHKLRYQGSGKRRAATRMFSVLNGRANTLNEIALSVATELVAS